VSFIDLKLAMEHGVKEGALGPDDKLCPEMSRYDLTTAPMAKEPELRGLSVLCIKDKCGKYNSCFNLPAREPRNPNAA
jgi:hypothetical protein